MIRVEELHSFEPGTEELLFPHTAVEYLRAGQLQTKFLKESSLSRAFYINDQLLCYAGIFRHSFLSPPLLWVLLGKGITNWSARVFRKLLREVKTLFPVLQTVVDVSYAAGHRFARACGFKPLDLVIEIDNRKFQFYEV